jgi:predicted membrane metal-binding protein
MSKTLRTATIVTLALAAILFFVVLPGWVFIPVIPALVLVVFAILSEKRPKRTQAQSSTPAEDDQHKAA